MFYFLPCMQCFIVLSWGKINILHTRNQDSFTPPPPRKISFIHLLVLKCQCSVLKCQRLLLGGWEQASRSWSKQYHQEDAYLIDSHLFLCSFRWGWCQRLGWLWTNEHNRDGISIVVPPPSLHLPTSTVPVALGLLSTIDWIQFNSMTNTEWDEQSRLEKERMTRMCHYGLSPRHNPHYHQVLPDVKLFCFKYKRSASNSTPSPPPTPAPL